jgi:hypothetical protein
MARVTQLARMNSSTPLSNHFFFTMCRSTPARKAFQERLRHEPASPAPTLRCPPPPPPPPPPSVHHVSLRDIMTERRPGPMEDASIEGEGTIPAITGVGGWGEDGDERDDKDTDQTKQREQQKLRRHAHAQTASSRATGCPLFPPMHAAGPPGALSLQYSTYLGCLHVGSPWPARAREDGRPRVCHCFGGRLGVWSCGYSQYPATTLCVSLSACLAQLPRPTTWQVVSVHSTSS